MSGVEWHKGPRCGVENCKSAFYRILDGLTYCRNGHQRQGVVQTQFDEDAFGSQGQTTRTKRDKKERVNRVYTGRQAFELFLQCYQLILWKQCHALVHEKGFPAELEIVVRDLWTLRLQILKEKHGDVSDTETESKLYSSQNETTETESDGAHERRDRGRKEKDLPGLIDTLGLCYLGMMLLRLPISMGDIHRWALNEDLPFIRAIRHIPWTMRSRLPAHFQTIVDSQSPLEPDDFINGIYQISALYHQNFKLEVSSLNYPPLLFRYIQDLALPLDLYTSAQTLASILSIDFSFPAPRFRQKPTSLPELQLIALLIIAVKLYHPFDALERNVRSTTDTGYLTIDWEVWTRAHRHHDEAIRGDQPFAPGSEMSLTEHDVMGMSNEQADAYMDWYEKMWVPKDGKEPTARSLPQELLDMFPTGRQDGSVPAPKPIPEERQNAEREAMTSKLKTMLGSLKVRNIVSDEEGKQTEPVRRLGAEYTYYRRVEDLTGHAKVFHEAVADLAGMQVKTLLRGICGIEMRLRRGREQELRRQYGEELIGLELGQADRNEHVMAMEDDEDEEMDVSTRDIEDGHLTT